MPGRFLPGAGRWKPVSAGRGREGRGALDLIDEAVHLLRRAPAGLLAVYYVGAMPFVLGLLYFWADMSRSAFAEKHLAASALGLAGLFIWMKCCQSVFLPWAAPSHSGPGAPASNGGEAGARPDRGTDGHPGHGPGRASDRPGAGLSLWLPVRLLSERHHPGG